MLGVLSRTIGVFLQAGPGESAARIRKTTGLTPDRLEPAWVAVGWAETAYVACAGAAYVVWGASR